jgi:hypothetical protein
VEELAGLFAGLSPEESRDALASTLGSGEGDEPREQRLRVARLMELLTEDESHAERWSAVEGLGLLRVMSLRCAVWLRRGSLRRCGVERRR